MMKPSDEKYELICVTGMDGSGKSTVVDTLLHELTITHGLIATEISVWDSIKNTSRGAHCLQQPRDELDGYLSLLCPEARMLFVLHLLSEAFAMARQSGINVGVINAHWYKYYASVLVQGGAEDRLLPIMGLLPSPNLTFFLDVPAKTTALRKSSFSGFETGYSETRDTRAFEMFQTKAIKVIDRLADRGDWIRVDASLDQTAVIECILGHPEFQNLISRL
ncbi:MAG: hypothetical protein ACYDC8_02925 [Gammaproteobacteria bacterium]